MKKMIKNLIIHQLDEKLNSFKTVKDIRVPEKGWVNTIRIGLNMSLAQLGKKLNITSQSVRELELREASRQITLKKLYEVADALNLQFVYGFIPQSGSLEKYIEKLALQKAKEIVFRTSHSMKLEEQENSGKRIKKAIKDKADFIKSEMPKYLWD